MFVQYDLRLLLGTSIGVLVWSSAAGDGALKKSRVACCSFCRRTYHMVLQVMMSSKMVTASTDSAIMMPCLIDIVQALEVVLLLKFSSERVGFFTPACCSSKRSFEIWTAGCLKICVVSQFHPVVIVSVGILIERSGKIS